MEMSGNIKPRLLYAPKKETQYQLNRLAVPQSQFRHFGEENKPFCRELNPGPSYTECYTLVPLRIWYLLKSYMIVSYARLPQSYNLGDFYISYKLTLNANACTLPR